MRWKVAAGVVGLFVVAGMAVALVFYAHERDLATQRAVADAQRDAERTTLLTQREAERTKAEKHLAALQALLDNPATDSITRAKVRARMEAIPKRQLPRGTGDHHPPWGDFPIPPSADPGEL